ncbi:phosphoribosyltransferase [Jiangella asiatica]|uniref:Phosphoribosyltransferase n=1 Tax=Jiangella asiatica TaxID=2530372 RepID=A0A4R5CIU0_9ACTN|nr:phosphoribosyltransferase family protein [Jiangella asiatica]TDE00132.1 phosphoribosyltransferase [Jiangella asiatica]
MPSGRVWRDRREAGEELGAALREQLGRPAEALVLGLPRGGVDVAAPVALELGGELDVLVVRKVGVPWQPELAAGAVTAAGLRVRNDDVIAHARISDQELEEAYGQAQTEARERERLLRGDRPPPRLGGRTVVIVDDGIATGATIRAAAELVASHRPAPEQVVAAVPVGPREAIDQLAELVDAVVVLQMPRYFAAVGAWYRDFSQVTDDEVRATLSR